MVEEPVQIRVSAESDGEAVYETHARGLSRISMGARQSILAYRDARKEMFQYQVQLMALNAGMSAANALFAAAGVENENLRKVMIGLNAAVALVNAALILKAVLEMRAAIAGWKHAIANIASAGWFAPLLLGIVSAAVVGAIALMGSSSRAMAYGGQGLVTSPTMFLAGERGPEYYSFTPMNKSGGGGGVTVGQVNITISSNDPGVVAASVVDEIRKLKEVGR